MAIGDDELRPMIANYHTHTIFSDGQSAPETYIDAAISREMPAIGFSDHAPLPFANNFAMAQQRLVEYASEIDELALGRAQIMPVFKGLEIDYIPGMLYPGHADFEELNLEYTIGAVHYVDSYKDGKPWNVDGSRIGFLQGLHEIFNDNIAAAVTKYFDLQSTMIADHQPTILAHMDRIKKHNFLYTLFDTDADWYLEAVTRLLDTLAANDTILEVNTKGFYSYGEPEFYPSRNILELAFERNIPVHPAADAHYPEHVNTAFELVIELLEDVGYTEIAQFDGHNWKSTPFPVHDYQV